MAEQDAREHYQWCIKRAMQYAEMGDVNLAWASFAVDCLAHDATAYIPHHPAFGMEMLRQTAVGVGAEEFRRFISGWALRPGS